MKQGTTRRNFLALAGGAVGLSALSYYVGVTDRAVAVPDETLPDYADNGLGFPVFRAPYLQKDAHLAAFLFNANIDRLTTLCDKTLNVSESSLYRYVPVSSSVMLVYADMLVSSRDERDAQVGLIPETEVGFWVLTIAMQKTRTGNVPHHLAWFLPYLLVDEGNSIAIGREVFGFNKQAAQFQKPAQIQQPEFTAQVLGFKEFNPQAIAQKETLLTLTASSPEVSQPSDADSLKNKIAAELLKNARTDFGSGLVEFSSGFINDQIPFVFLKQFRDAHDSRKACYQKIIEAQMKVESFYEGGAFLKAYTLNIAALASHPIAQNLGLSAEQNSSLGAWMRVEFSLETTSRSEDR